MLIRRGWRGRLGGEERVSRSWLIGILRHCPLLWIQVFAGERRIRRDESLDFETVFDPVSMSAPQVAVACESATIPYNYPSRYEPTCIPDQSQEQQDGRYTEKDDDHEPNDCSRDGAHAD